MSRLPTITPRQMVAALRRVGFVEQHQKGSHLYLWNEQRRLMTCVPIHPGDLDRKIMKAILKQAGVTEDEFRDLL